MSAWQGFVLGMVQGLTEFLPVSSSGHLVAVRSLFGITGSRLAFDVMVHGATLLAIVVYFRRRLAGFIREGRLDYLGKLLVATIPIGAVGLALGEPVEEAFASPWLVAALLAATGTMLLSLYLKREDEGERGRLEPGWGVAIAIGLVQAVAILPGISRSGATIVAGLWLGLAPAAAAEFSFLLGIPAIAGAVGVELSAMHSAASTDAGAGMLLGGLAAFACGMAAIAIVFRVLARRSFRRFGFYCWAVAIAFGTWLALGGGSG
ncbi:MAG: undecaprenyl-diphosphate phosphatase [Gemmatimonadota bacterium]|nr:undecaprenyl-diphosphate phosphatase [Gemmatimonadota bacterium]